MSMLKLDNDKTELLVIYPKSVDATTLSFSVKVGYVHIQPSAHARNVGAAFDSVMGPDQYVQNICLAAYYLLHSISRIRRHLDVQSVKQLIQALVISRLDKCNSRLHWSAYRPTPALAGCSECLRENHHGPWRVRTHNPSTQGLKVASNGESHPIQDPGAHLQMPARTCSSIHIWLTHRVPPCQDTTVSWLTASCPAEGQHESRREGILLRCTKVMEQTYSSCLPQCHPQTVQSHSENSPFQRTLWLT